MYKYFVTYAFAKSFLTSDESGFGNSYIISEEPLLTEEKIRETEKILKKDEGYAKLTLLNIIEITG